MLRSRLRCFSSSSGRAVDTLVVGGGVMGSSLALHLASLRGTGEGITVVERDPTYQTASATLSAGGIRQQFSLLENVQMSLYGVEFLRHAAERLAQSTSRRGAAAYGDAHMVGTCRGAAGEERPPAAERRLTVWPICCLEGSFPYKTVISSPVARGRSALHGLSFNTLH